MIIVNLLVKIVSYVPKLFLFLHGVKICPIFQLIHIFFVSTHPNLTDAPLDGSTITTRNK